MKLVYTIASNNRGTLIAFNGSTGERIDGHFYSVSAVRRYAKRHGWNGVKKADTTFLNFVEQVFDRKMAQVLA
jgi:hypothetical protein